ncbi:TetR family transcriptional regulator [Paraburkholderia caffeinilytica]|uniref:TetR family transcriptional regulator n=1 Tax=Paraburkholderia caffeinilytica TaxID=1761016 RepID=UPI0038B73E9D
MGNSQTNKALNRERMLVEAAGQIRDGGLDSLSVNKLMQSLDLTHGGFYGHFSSRSELLAKALERALMDGEARAVGDGRSPSYAGIVRSYLSRRHRDARKTGCAISALVSDAGRSEVEVREIMSQYIERYIEELERSLGDDGDSRAIVALSALIGAVTISRVVTDAKRADAIAGAVREHLLGFLSDEATSEKPAPA